MPLIIPIHMRSQIRELIPLCCNHTDGHCLLLGGIVDQAEPANEPSNVNHFKDLIIFSFLGLVVAAMYILIVNMLDTTIKSSEDIEKITKLPVLATVPIYEQDSKKKKKGGKR